MERIFYNVDSKQISDRIVNGTETPNDRFINEINESISQGRPLDDISFDPGMKYGALILFAEKNEMSTEAKKLKALIVIKNFSCFK